MRILFSRTRGLRILIAFNPGSVPTPKDGRTQAVEGKVHPARLLSVLERRRASRGVPSLEHGQSLQVFYTASVSSQRLLLRN